MNYFRIFVRPTREALIGVTLGGLSLVGTGAQLMSVDWLQPVAIAMMVLSLLPAVWVPWPVMNQLRPRLMLAFAGNYLILWVALWVLAFAMLFASLLAAPLFWLFGTCVWLFVATLSATFWAGLGHMRLRLRRFRR